MDCSELLKGALEINNGYPSRLTKTQRAWYHGLSKEFADRADCTAGASLRFITEEKSFSLSYDVVSYCRSTNVIDVLEDGVHTGSVRLPDMQSHETVNICRETTGRCEVELVLPNTCGMRIRNLNVQDAVPAPSKSHKLLCIGDSILQGIQSYHPTSSLANLLALELDAQLLNQSVGGAGFYPALLEPLPFDPDWIFVAMGINDVRAPEDDPVLPRIREWFEKLRGIYPQQKITAVTPIWNTRFTGEPGYAEKAEAIRLWIRENGEKWGIQVLDGNAMVPHSRSFFNEDGLHPNDLGFQCYARGVLRQLNWK